MLLESRSLPETQVIKRLMALAGASREWNWPGFGLVTIHQLDEAVALGFYERFPDLLRGPFKLHVQPNIRGTNYFNGT